MSCIHVMTGIMGSTKDEDYFETKSKRRFVAALNDARFVSHKCGKARFRKAERRKMRKKKPE